jgi:PAS domain S-box-containing protein
MAEVSCDAIDFVSVTLARRGIALERALEGSGVTVERLRARSRLTWDEFTRVMDAFEALVGGPDAVEAAAEGFFERPYLLSTVLRFAVEPRHLFWLVCRIGGRQFFSNVESSFDAEPDGTIRVELRIPSGYRDCPTFFRVSRAAFSRYPTVLGQPPAPVDMVLGPRHATYRVRMLPQRGGLLRRVLRAAVPGRRDRAILAQLAEQHQQIQGSLVELRRANDVIAEQKRVIERSEARWRSLVQSAPDHVLVLDPDGVVLFVNRVHPDGRPEDLVGRNLAEAVAPERRAVVVGAVRAAVDEGRTSAWEGAWGAPGRDVRTWSVRLSPIVEEGRITGALFVARDVTDARREQNERLDLERRVLQAEKLESLGILAGGIAHDFNNLLAGIVSNAGMAGMLLGPDSPATPYVDRVETGAMRAAGLIDQLLAYAGRGRFEVRALDLSSLVAELLQLLSAGLPKSAAIRSSLAPALPAVEGDASQLQQVVMNLVTNAAEALGGASGEVSVRTGAVSWPDDAVAEPRPSDLAPGEYVLVEVSDNGAGMDDATLARMFDPFFTTKRGGRGLGLAAVQGIVKRHRGALVVRSRPGEGTTFRVFLPASPLPAAPEPEPTSDRTRAGRGTVLIVDDEPGVREGAASLLAHQGFEVLQAADGHEALRIFRDRADAVTVVLLDKTMPGLDGVEVFRELRALRPDVRVVMSSAYDAGDVAVEGLRGFLRKPCRPDALADAIRRAARG